MLKRLVFLAMYWLSWILFFQLFRIIFLLYHYKKTLALHSRLWAQIAWHGLRMDISFASYILVIPALLIAFTGKYWKWYGVTMKIYSMIIAFIMVMFTVIDLELFKAWGFRLDSTSLHYLQTPAEAIASMGAAPVLPLSILLVLLFALVFWTLEAIENRSILFFQKASIPITFISFLALTGSLIIPIRGGLQQIPMNESNAFFSDKSFANYAAINLPWNYASSVINNSYSTNNPYLYFDKTALKSRMSGLLQNSGKTEELIERSVKPNVIVIIWESFTAKVVQSLGGRAGVTPQFDKLTRDGLLFTNLYASGNRSDKGMVAILSGYPAQPVESIIKIPRKTATLPSMTEIFRSNGYSTSFYYGGETEFANMKSYLLQQGFDQIIDKHAFRDEDMNSKWGAHDHVVLNKLIQDLDHQRQPFFSTLFTLSSHEPFEVPVNTVIPGKDQESLFLNAHHYTDQAIGDFIRTARQKPWWKNTLIVIIADHGHPLPEKPEGKLNEFHIPMLWLGGALRKTNNKIDTLSSQTDLAATLLGQVGLPAQSFIWSNNILMQNRRPFAYFAFNNGMTWIRPDGYVVRDNIGGNIIEKKGGLSEAEINRGKAYLQASFTDYLNR